MYYSTLLESPRQHHLQCQHGLVQWHPATLYWQPPAPPSSQLPGHQTVTGREISMAGASAKGTARGFSTRSRIWAPSSPGPKKFFRSSLTTMVDSDSSVSKLESDIACFLFSSCQPRNRSPFTHLGQHALQFGIFVAAPLWQALDPQVDHDRLLL